jgi:hypothetical protein
VATASNPEPRAQVETNLARNDNAVSMLALREQPCAPIAFDVPLQTPGASYTAIERGDFIIAVANIALSLTPSFA